MSPRGDEMRRGQDKRRRERTKISWIPGIVSEVDGGRRNERTGKGGLLLLEKGRSDGVEKGEKSGKAAARACYGLYGRWEDSL